jgi:hypothetical protein
MKSPAGEPAPVRPPGPDGDADRSEGGEGVVELASGVLFMAIGAFGLVIGRAYPSGTALNMGPGYLPKLVAGALVGLGLIGVVRGLMIGNWSLPRMALRPLLCIALAIVVFALTIDRFGLFLATFATALIGTAAQARMEWRRAPLIALALAGFCVLLFGYGLKLSMPVWPR